VKSGCNGHCQFRARERKAASHAGPASLSARDSAHGSAIGSLIRCEQANLVVT
jgi:hypothetical protein